MTQPAPTLCGGLLAKCAMGSLVAGVAEQAAGWKPVYKVCLVAGGAQHRSVGMSSSVRTSQRAMRRTARSAAAGAQ